MNTELAYVFIVDEKSPLLDGVVLKRFDFLCECELLCPPPCMVILDCIDSAK